MEQLEIMKIMSQEERMRILNLLLNGKICRKMLVEIMNSSEDKIERAINKLVRNNIITLERDGERMLYALSKNGYENIMMIQNIIASICIEPKFLYEKRQFCELKDNCNRKCESK